MTPETESNINETINWLQQAGGTIQTFALEQAPLYCREVVAWEFWGGTIFGGLGVIVFALGIVYSKMFFKWMKEDDGEPTLRTISTFTAAIGCLLLGFMGIEYHIPRAIKASVSPRLVIIEHLSKLKQ
jgi:H+/Cl- antiporter ClcA